MRWRAGLAANRDSAADRGRRIKFIIRWVPRAQDVRAAAQHAKCSDGQSVPAIRAESHPISSLAPRRPRGRFPASEAPAINASSGRDRVRTANPVAGARGRRRRGDHTHPLTGRQPLPETTQRPIGPRGRRFNSCRRFLTSPEGMLLPPCGQPKCTDSPRVASASSLLYSGSCVLHWIVKR
jgi:hypothetical protein